MQHCYPLPTRRKTALAKTSQAVTEPEQQQGSLAVIAPELKL